MSVGTLTIVRANHPSFTDEQGGRWANPVRTDQLLITLTDAKGEVISYFEVPMEERLLATHASCVCSETRAENT